MLNISLPDTLQAFLESQIAATGASDESEYISALLSKEQARVSQQGRIEALLIECFESGDAIEAADDRWDEKRSQLINRHVSASEA